MIIEEPRDWEATQAWRHLPPTEKQIDHLREMDMATKGRFTRPKTRGEASDRISDLHERARDEISGWEQDRD